MLTATSTTATVITEAQADKGLPPFVQIHHYLMETPAWRGLSIYAKAAYPEIVRRHNGRNNGRIYMSARELAADLGCSKSTATDALSELVTAGFLDVVVAGNFKRKRIATEYRLTAFDCDITGTPASKRFLQAAPAAYENGHRPPRRPPIAKYVAKQVRSLLRKGTDSPSARPYPCLVSTSEESSKRDSRPKGGESKEGPTAPPDSHLPSHASPGVNGAGRNGGGSARRLRAVDDGSADDDVIAAVEACIGRGPKTIAAVVATSESHRGLSPVSPVEILGAAYRGKIWRDGQRVDVLEEVHP